MPCTDEKATDMGGASLRVVPLPFKEDYMFITSDLLMVKRKERKFYLPSLKVEEQTVAVTRRPKYPPLQSALKVIYL